MNPTLVSAALVASVLGVAPTKPSRRLGEKTQGARILPVAVIAAAVVAVMMVERLSWVIAGSIAAGTVTHSCLARRRKREAVRRQEIISAFLGHTVTSLRAGGSLAQACDHAIGQLPKDCPARLHGVCGQLATAAHAGSSPQDVLDADAPEELKEVAALWSLSLNRGLATADLLSRARDRFEATRRHREATDAALAGPKTTALVLTVLPLAGLAMGSAMGANPLGFLLSGGLGGWLLVIGTALVCAGFVTCQRIITGATT